MKQFLFFKMENTKILYTLWLILENKNLFKLKQSVFQIIFIQGKEKYEQHENVTQFKIIEKVGIIEIKLV